MAGNGTLTNKGFTTKFKKLKGETLAEVDKVRKKNGMVDPNSSKRFYAVTDVTIGLDIGTEVWYPGAMNVLQFMVHMNPQLANPLAEVSAVITICVPDKLGKMSPAAKKEWKRFYTALVKHEKEHVADGKKLAQEMLDELAEISVELKTQTLVEQKVKKEALKLLDAAALKKFGGGEIAKRINAAMKKRDGGGHGGVHLNTSIT